MGVQRCFLTTRAQSYQFLIKTCSSLSGNRDSWDDNILSGLLSPIGKERVTMTLPDGQYTAAIDAVMRRTLALVLPVLLWGSRPQMELGLHR